MGTMKIKLLFSTKILSEENFMALFKNKQKKTVTMETEALQAQLNDISAKLAAVTAALDVTKNTVAEAAEEKATPAPRKTDCNSRDLTAYLKSADRQNVLKIMKAMDGKYLFKGNKTLYDLASKLDSLHLSGETAICGAMELLLYANKGNLIGADKAYITDTILAAMGVPPLFNINLNSNSKEILNCKTSDLVGIFSNLDAEKNKTMVSGLNAIFEQTRDMNKVGATEKVSARSK